MNSRLKIINNGGVWLILVFLIVGMLGFFFIERNNNKPIIIGFAAQLTGRQAELGVQERNGVQLAVEKINASGGIAGRKIKLIIRDDFGIPEKAQSVDNELIKEGAVAIIGHATTTQTLAGLKVTNPAKVVMIGPTVSTPKLSGLDDYFFRVYPSFKDSCEAFAQYIYQRRCMTRMSIIYDKDNCEYSKTYSTIFSDKFRSLGGNIANEISFSAITHPDFYPLLLNLQKDKAEGLLIIASDMDAAFIAQRIKLMGWQIPLFTTGWSQTETFINNGGHAFEGIQLVQSYLLTSELSAFNDFKSCYESRFGNVPSFGAVFGYEAVLVLEEALKKTGGKPKELKQALLEIHDFKVLINNISLDRFGDVQRPFYLSSISNGKFIILDKLALTKSGGE